jgi:hypothetical protein
MPVEMKYGLTAPGANVDDHTVILEPSESRCLGDELEHPGCLIIRERANFTERVDMAGRENEQVYRGFRGDIADRDESLGSIDVRAGGDESAEEAVGS